MSQNNTAEKAKMLAIIESINKINDFDPSVFAVDFTDLSTGEVRKRLPVMIQIAWFRLKYPEGKIAVSTVPSGECFIATARIYPSYKDPENAYLAEGTASRAPCPDKPSVSPREWAQTAAVGLALRNAGFGLQFAAAGEDFAEIAPDELCSEQGAESSQTETGTNAALTDAVAPPVRPELTPEEKLQQAMKCPCPITKYKGKTLGDVLQLDPKALDWLANKFEGNETIKAAAKTICEYAVSQAVA